MVGFPKYEKYCKKQWIFRRFHNPEAQGRDA
jgi:hypothetical protein